VTVVAAIPIPPASLQLVYRLGDGNLRELRVPAMSISDSGRCRSPVPAMAITPGRDVAG